AGALRLRRRRLEQPLGRLPRRLRTAGQAASCRRKPRLVRLPGGADALYLAAHRAGGADDADPASSQL
ncbi:MAG: hypothetical protein AVDCRST_MAG27-2492, partial [uncultured Craurococcus sp.]